MTRWEPDSQRRMQEAALELFSERGYSRTTAAEIAERAGLTERTFFRHFSDKREVLFASEDESLDLLTTAIEAVEGLSAVEAVTAGLDVVADLIQQSRPEASLQRARIVAAHEELQERELKKLASWSIAIERVLREKGLAGDSAGLLAEVSVAVFYVAYRRWLDEGAVRDLGAIIGEAFAELGGLVGHDVLEPSAKSSTRTGSAAGQDER